MTSIAVTASICASASEVALLVASFMSFSLNLGVTHRCASEREGQIYYSEHPTTIICFDESPLSKYRRCQGRPAIRRHFGSGAAGLCACDGIFKANFEQALAAQGVAVAPESSARYCFESDL
jgi:hypothetical protein